MADIMDVIYGNYKRVSDKAPAEQYSEITIGRVGDPDPSMRPHVALHVNYGSTDKGTGGAEKGHFCRLCGQMFKESKMMQIGGVWYCLENGDAQDVIKEMTK